MARCCFLLLPFFWTGSIVIMLQFHEGSAAPKSQSAETWLSGDTGVAEAGNGIEQLSAGLPSAPVCDETYLGATILEDGQVSGLWVPAGINGTASTAGDATVVTETAADQEDPGMVENNARWRAEDQALGRRPKCRPQPRPTSSSSLLPGLLHDIPPPHVETAAHAGGSTCSTSSQDSILTDWESGSQPTEEPSASPTEAGAPHDGEPHGPGTMHGATIASQAVQASPIVHHFGVQVSAEDIEATYRRVQEQRQKRLPVPLHKRRRTG